MGDGEKSKRGRKGCGRRDNKGTERDAGVVGEGGRGEDKGVKKVVS